MVGHGRAGLGAAGWGGVWQGWIGRTKNVAADWQAPGFEPPAVTEVG
jgi:hypothetical protein